MAFYSSQSNEVDVRDLAAAHVLSISVEAAGNNRFAISKQPYTWQICLDEVANDDKVKKARPKIPTGKPGADNLADQNGKRALLPDMRIVQSISILICFCDVFQNCSP